MVDIKRLLRNKTVTFAVPFFIFMIGGSFYLREFTDLRYKYNTKSKILNAEEMKKLGIEFDPTKGTIEEEYNKIKDKDWDNWENKRIPRPWEETTVENS